MSYIMGIDPTKVRTSAQGPEFKLGAIGMTTDSAGLVRHYIYVTSTAGVTGAGYVVQVSPGGSATMVTSTTGAAGTGQGLLLGVGVAAISALGFGWVQIGGSCSVRAAASATARTQMASTSTAGVAGVGTSGGLVVLDGLSLNSTNGGAEATVAGYLVPFGKIGRTLT